MLNISWAYINILFLLFITIEMANSTYNSLPISAINPCNKFMMVFIRLMQCMCVRTCGRHKIWKVIFMDHQVFLLCIYIILWRYYIVLQCDEILGSMEGDDAINRWISILKVGKVYYISELSVDVAIDGERNVVINNLKLVFTRRTRLLDGIDDCPDIPCQHLLPFMLFINVLWRLRLHDNIIGKYSLQITIYMSNLLICFSRYL